jgi:predicted nucleic acid-binding protein
VKHFILDSSVYISYLNPKDVLHIETKRFINKITSPDINFIVPIIVFLEVGNVLQKILPKFRNEDLIRFFEDHTIVSLDLQQAYELLAIFKNFNLKTSDAIILGTAILNNARLITWDEKFKKGAKKLLDVQTPKTFISLLEQAPS